MRNKKDSLHNISLPYRRGVGMMLLNSDNKVFVGKRLDSKGDIWQMPQGGIDGDETPMEAAYRELLEETSISSVKFLSESSKWFFYDVPEFLVGRLWGGRFRGQKQKWVLFAFTGEESEINVSTSHAEFEEWKWVPVEELPELVVSFKKNLYQSIVKEFSTNIKSLDDA
jgi:putative (di)nucleoside polyphosphate hydrolase